MTDLARYLYTISGGDSTALIEMRFSTKLGMRQEWHFAGDSTLPARIVEEGSRADTYVGVAPRTHEAGGRAAVKSSHVLWVDLDRDDAADRIAAFEHPPTMTVASGTSGHLHAYWQIAKPLSRVWVERANRRLAHHLGGDVRCADAARILRPPGTMNFKTDPPTPVDLASHTGQRYSVMALVADLPDPSTRPALDGPRDVDPSDTLGSIAPPVYVARLTGRTPNVRGKIACPMHGGGNERTPSFHVYPDVERGWRCFGCDKGGTVYDLGAALWGMGTRGDDFKRLRERIAGEMGVTL